VVAPLLPPVLGSDYQPGLAPCPPGSSYLLLPGSQWSKRHN